MNQVYPENTSRNNAQQINGFARHGIKHLSASSINLWMDAPDLWVAKYLHGHRQSFGPAPRRGQCVEDAVMHVLNGGKMDEGVGKALAKFDDTFFIPDDASVKQRALIEPMTMHAVAELEKFGIPPDHMDDGQEKISINARLADGSVIPVIGFLDMAFSDHGVIVDLKTTTRIPTRMSPAHQRQRAIYASAKGNYAVKFLYVSETKSVWREDGDVAETMAGLKAAILRMERFLSAHDADSALACVPHNPDHFFWRDDTPDRVRLFGR